MRRLNWANRVTIFRILLLVPFMVVMLKRDGGDVSESMKDILRYIAFVLFMLMAISDGIDGYLARKRGQITKLGTFLDPTADKLLMTCTCLLLAIPVTAVKGFVLEPTVAVLIIGKDLFLLIGFIIVYFTTFRVTVVPVKIGKIATCLQLTMAAGILLGPEISKVIPCWLSVLKVIWWSAAGTAILTTLIYIRNGSRYIAEYEQQNSKD